MESLFRCPICREPLTREERRYLCPRNHSFDLAAAGHTHLLPSNKMHSQNPGDDKAMAAARNRFLSGGYYAPLAWRLSELTLRYTGEAPVVYDSGCGEGYYTAELLRALQSAGRSPRMAGIDISKECLRRAAKRAREIEFAVASAYDLPFADESGDFLLNCFSPLALDEFRRVLRPGGVFAYVVPGARHLYEMKEILYDAPYENEEKETPYEGFSYLGIESVDERIHLPDPDTIRALFTMTPYFWKTPKEGRERLEAREELDVTISFRVHLFERVDS
ncbi:MAG: methyltransferase domain-containing protein [Ruminococcaceae bacterium]|nr:methyltransferase domain-containing protein [Oscillospiraceae bacterium]